MFKNSYGKLVVYASSFTSYEKRLKFVNAAAERMAKVLDLDVEIITLKKEFVPIYVYYKNGEEEPVPIYYDKGENSDVQKICTALRNMMFALSFHPKHSALKEIRKEIMRFC